MSDNYKIPTIVVEDEEQNLNSICNKIELLDNTFEIVGKALNGQDAIEKIKQLRPQVMFTDIYMPVMDGMELIRRVKQSFPSIIIVIISGYSDFSYAQGAIKYGVFNYLLKPLESDALLETLTEIKQNLSSTRHNLERHIAYSENYQLLPDPDERFLIAAVCLGNIIYESQNEDTMGFYAKQVLNISWNRILEDLCIDKEWFVTDEYAVNQKIIAIKIKQEEIAYQEKWEERLLKIIREKTELPVSICTLKESVAHEEIWDYVKRLRNTLRHKLMIGESHIFYLESMQEKNDVIEIVKVKLNTYIKNYYNSKNLETFMNEIRTIFKYLRKNHASQDSIAKICIYVLHLLEFSDQGYKREELEELRREIMNNISISMTEDELFERLLRNIESINFIHEQKSQGEKLLDYVNENFLAINSIEQVADELGYNYTYLSRLFKKRAGMSMNRYITEKKIKFARELIEEKKEMRIIEISDLCGYEDYRYFSRVFKAATGVSPSEYKEKINERNR